jgi:leucyl-tRNA synthetase
MLDARDKYRLGSTSSGLSPSLLRKYITSLALLIAPICPHWAEEVWSGPLAQPGCVVRARWPVPPSPVDASLTAAGEYLFTVAHLLSGSLSNFDKKAAKGKVGGKGGEPLQRPNQINVYVATQFPDWKVSAPRNRCCLRIALECVPRYVLFTHVATQFPD